MEIRLIGLGLLLVGGLTVRRFTRAAAQLEVRATSPGTLPGSGTNRYRAGPWPGLSPAGAVVLLGCALLLAGAQLALGDPRVPLPDLPLLGAVAVLPMALATRLVRAPGAASAVCGAYLLPRALVSLVDPGTEPSALLLVPAVVFDLSAWLRASDLARLRRMRAPVTPDVTRTVTARSYAGGGRRGLVGPRRFGRVRAGVAGAVFGGVLAVTEPAFRVLLGADPAVWYGPVLWLAGGLTSLACALAGLAAASGPDTTA